MTYKKHLCFFLLFKIRSPPHAADATKRCPLFKLAKMADMSPADAIKRLREIRRDNRVAGKECVAPLGPAQRPPACRTLPHADPSPLPFCPARAARPPASRAGASFPRTRTWRVRLVPPPSPSRGPPPLHPSASPLPRPLPPPRASPPSPPPRAAKKAMLAEGVDKDVVQKAFKALTPKKV